MSKLKFMLIFMLGTFFGVSASLMSINVFMDYIYNINEDAGGVQTSKLDTSNILTSLKNSLKTVPIGNSSEKYKKFDNIWNVLNKQYFDNEKLDFSKMTENAIKGYVDALQDPYTVYFTTTENQSFQDDLKGEKDFEGIGAVVQKKDGGVMIEEVIKGSPSFNAGLKPLDIIVEINGEKTKDLTLGEAVSKIRGPKGTQVELTLIRKDTQELVKLKVTRDKIVIPSVSGKVLSLSGGANVGYINISIIGEDTERALQGVISEFSGKNLSGVILDLRGNGGGYLPIAVELVSHFVPEGDTVVTSRYRIYPPEVYKSYGYEGFQGLPVVILVDGMTASASEIISAALRDNIGAYLIGTKTFGKGSIQTIYDLKDGSSLKYTIGKWYTPKGDNVDQKGIEPDQEVKLDTKLFQEKEIDNQLDAAKSKIFDIINKK